MRKMKESRSVAEKAKRQWLDEAAVRTRKRGTPSEKGFMREIRGRNCVPFLWFFYTKAFKSIHKTSL